MITLIKGQFEKIVLENPLFGPNKISLSIMDPPDNEGRKYNGYDDNLPDEQYVDLLAEWLRSACYITDGPVFISFSSKWTRQVEDIIHYNNIPLIQRLQWHYTFGQAHKKRYTPSVRPIYWLNKDIIYDDKIRIASMRIIKYKDKRANPLGKLPDNVWDFSRICGTFKERRKFHPTQHPEALIERIILGHSQIGETILDPFVGSGTTAIVCKKLNRNCVGIDCSQFYIDKIKETLNL